MFFSDLKTPFSLVAKIARQRAKQLTKMDDAPWVSLIKQGDGKPLYDLEDIFKNYEKSDAMRILFKSGPGQSKTIICQQLLWYWVNGKLSGFPIVILVSLKPSNKDKDIGDIIMEQYPMFEGSGITKHQILGIIENFVSSILLLIDGFENENVDAHKIVKQQKFAFCNVFVTSSPHFVANYEKEFDTVFVSNGFAREQAQMLASRVIKNTSVVHAIVDFNPGDFEPLYKCPFAFSATCTLSQDDISEENRIIISYLTEHIGIFYSKIARCWHKTVALRKGIKYDKMELLEKLKKIGELAYILLCGEGPFLVN